MSGNKSSIGETVLTVLNRFPQPSSVHPNSFPRSETDRRSFLTPVVSSEAGEALCARLRLRFDVGSGRYAGSCTSSSSSSSNFSSLSIDSASIACPGASLSWMTDISMISPCSACTFKCSRRFLVLLKIRPYASKRISTSASPSPIPPRDSHDTPETDTAADARP